MKLENLDLVLELRRLDLQVDARQYAEARAGLTALLAQARRRGITSPFLHWLLGIALDQVGETEAAVHHFKEALKLDPLAPPFHHSRDLVHSRLVAQLHDAARAVDAEDIPTLYELARALGPIRGETHLVMARYLQAKGEVARALELTRAVQLLDESPDAAELADALSAGTQPLLGPSSRTPALA
jgi:tetratricopeptide (TPR) repeat protein